MKAVPTMPTFIKIDVNALKTVNWTDKVAAKTAVTKLQDDVMLNTNRRTAYLKDALAASTERIKVMQEGVKAAKDKKPSPPDIDKDDKLKVVRDEVKFIMEKGKEEEKAFYAAMDDFRLAKIDFAGTLNDYVGKIRTMGQDASKDVAPIPSQLTSLEAVSSGLIKEIRSLRGELGDNLKRKEKIESAHKKAGEVKKDAGTGMDKVQSAAKYIKDNMSKLPAILGEMQTRAKDLNNGHERFKTAMGALETFRESVKVMIKGFTGIGFEDATKPMLKEIETWHSELIKRRDESEKMIKEVRKLPALPESVKKALPEKL